MIALAMLALGLAMLVTGGRSLVSGSLDVARRVGVPPLLIGLTLVAWGTSAPELAFNLIAAVRGKPDLVFGNTVGANICNLGLVIGVSALLARLVVHSTIIRRELPIMLGIFGLMLGGALSEPLHEAAGGRLIPIVLLSVFLGYSVYVIQAGLRARPDDRELATEAEALTQRVAPRRLPVSLGLMGVGLALLSVGGNLAADAATDIALWLGMSQRVVGLTVVSVGTTLPELVTSIVAVRRGEVDLAVGNAVGSCVFNLGMIFALAWMIAPAPIPSGGLGSVAAMCVLGSALVPMIRLRSKTLARLEGTILLLLYFGYIGYELTRTGP
jgi:cation:H+ antiporter